jgi:hypothetical protein
MATLNRRMKRSFIRLKIEGERGQSDEELGYAGLFASIQGTITEFMDLYPIMAVMLFQVASLRTAHQFIKSSAFIEKVIMYAQ